MTSADTLDDHAGPAWHKTSALDENGRRWIAEFLRDCPWFEFYYRCALDDLARTGLDNRFYRVGTNKAGLILGISFDAVNIFSTVGELSEDDLLSILDFDAEAELHLEAEHVGPLRAAIEARGRLRRVSALRYYRRAPQQDDALIDQRCLPIESQADKDALRSFFRQHYPETVLSDWMFDHPLLGLFEEGALLAAAGCLVVNAELGAAHLGNFLTHPAHRGRGLGKAVGRALIAALHAQQIRSLMLGVFEENDHACRLYASLGFEHLETRPLIYIDRRYLR